jgi:glutamine amidotransferase
MGNLTSVSNALSFIGCDVIVTSSADAVSKAEILVLPGVGSFGRGMSRLIGLGLDNAIRSAVVEQGAKILGICLGMQMLGIDSTEDGLTMGLGLIPHRVSRFPEKIASNPKIPHVGFNAVQIKDIDSNLFFDIPNNSDFYFVHSYRMKLDHEDGDIAVCSHGEDFLAAYEKLNIYATQFHPEKSHAYGLMVLKNFVLGNNAKKKTNLHTFI